MPTTIISSRIISTALAAPLALVRRGTNHVGERVSCFRKRLVVACRSDTRRPCRPEVRSEIGTSASHAPSACALNSSRAAAVASPGKNCHAERGTWFSTGRLTAGGTNEGNASNGKPQREPESRRPAEPAGQPARSAGRPRTQKPGQQQQQKPNQKPGQDNQPGRGGQEGQRDQGGQR